MHHSTPAEHAQHDLDLIAGHAAGDLTETQRIRADYLLQTCASCADLLRDLIAIAAATRTAPAPKAPRDFRLTAAQAARLRRGGWLRSMLRPLAAPRSSVRPMAMAFTSLGLAGLFVTTVLPSLFFFGSAASAPAPAAIQPAASAAAAGSEAPELLSGGGQPQATRDADVPYGPAGQPTAGSVGGSSSGKANDLGTAAPWYAGGGAERTDGVDAQMDQLTAGRNTERDMRVSGPSPIVIGSLLLLVLGLALFGLRFLARRTV